VLPVVSATGVAHGSAQYLEMTLVLVDGCNAPVLLDELCRFRELCRDRDGKAATPLAPTAGSVVC